MSIFLTLFAIILLSLFLLVVIIALTSRKKRRETETPELDMLLFRRNRYNR